MPPSPVTAAQVNALADARRITVAVYIMHAKGFSGLRRLALTLEQRGHQVLLLLDTRCAHFDVSGPGQAFLADPAELEAMDRVDVFFTVDLEDARFPERSVVVGVNHTYWEDVDPRDPENAASMFSYFRRYDAFLHHLPGLGTILETVGGLLCRPDFHPREVFRRTSSQCVFIPAGYLNLDAMADHAARSGRRPEALLYAPTAAFRDRALLDAEDICAALLEAFPDLPFIFRPHPGEIHHYERLAQRFADHPRFTLDARVTNLEAFAQSRVLITDASSSGHSFAMANCRPMVLASLKPGAALLEEWDFGYRTAGRDNLVLAVRRLLDNEEPWAARIDAARRKYVLNPGRACAYVADNLERIARADPAPDWFALPRKPRTRPMESAREWCALVASLRREPGGKSFALAMLDQALAIHPGDPDLEDLAWSLRLARDLPWLAFGIGYSGPGAPRLERLREEDVAALFERGEQRFMIWGASGGYRNVWRRPLLRFRPAAFLGFVDRNPDLRGALIDGFPVHAPEDVATIRPAAVVVGSVYGGAIRDNLSQVLAASRA